MKSRLLVILVAVLASYGLSQAGWFEDTLENTGKRLGNKGVNEAGDSAYGAAKGAVKGKKAPDGKAGVVKKPVASTDDEPDTPKAGRTKGGQEASDSTVSIDEAETVYSKFDFIPGDLTMFFDDFSDTDVGEFPRKWTLNGPKQGNSNTIEVAEYQGKRFLRSVPGAKGQPPATQYIRLDQKDDFPEKFTIEFDAALASINNSPVYYVMYKVLLVPADKKVDVFKRAGQGSVIISGQDNVSANTITKMQLNDGKVHHISISVNGTFVKAYIDNQRVINDPDAIKRPLKQIGIQMLTPNNFRSDKLLFTNFRLAEGGKDIKSALDSNGRIITHGILFDTGRDTIKPESLPTLKKILTVLNDDPGLKFTIEGHTDALGSTGANQPLSEQRAAAVKSWLTGKGIDPARLRTGGFGDSKPLDSNSTPEGRANNRRVEFVRFQ